MRVSMNAEFYDMATADMMMVLESKGTRIPVYSPHTGARAWCEENCKSFFASSSDSVLIDEEVYNRSRKIASGELPNPRLNMDKEWFEAAISDQLAKEMNREIDREIAAELGYKLPYLYFWFADRDEAMLFKLTWGGK